MVEPASNGANIRDGYAFARTIPKITKITKGRK